MSTSLEPLFRPRAVTVVGAAGDDESPYARPLRYLRRTGFLGPIHAVNPRYGQLLGEPCFPDLDAVPGPIDLVMFLVGARRTVPMVVQAARLGARAAIVCSSGFGEVGPAGAALQEELATAARANGIRLLGPNSQGLFYRPSGLAATFSGAAEIGFPENGRAAYVGQSGAIGGVVLDLAREAGMGLSAWVSTGNESDVSTVEAATWLSTDPDIDVLMIYLESMPNGEEYRALLEHAREHGTRLVVLRSGSSAAGRRAVASHTGSMVGSDTALRHLSRRFGAALVEDVDELVEVAHALSAFPPMARDRIAVVTTSGGAGALAADACAQKGLRVEALSEGLQKTLAEVVPSFGAISNPVDVTVQLLTRDDDSFSAVCHQLTGSEEVDGLLVLATSPIGELGRRLAHQLVDVTTKSTKPVLTCWMAGAEQTLEGRSIFRAASVPLFRSPSHAVGTLARMAESGGAYAKASQTAGHHDGRVVSLPELPSGSTIIEGQVAHLLDAAGVPRPRGVLVHNGHEARAAVRDLGGCAVMKVQSPRILHKTDMGGVRLGVTEAAAASVHAELAKLLEGDDQALGVLVQESVLPLVELIVGVTEAPPGFPPVLTVGMGGTATEVYADIASTVLPVDRSTVRGLLLSLRGAPLLTGHRGRPPADLEAAIDAIVGIAQVATAVGPSLREMEVNPLAVMAEGACALDFLLARHEGDAT